MGRIDVIGLSITLRRHVGGILSVTKLWVKMCLRLQHPFSGTACLLLFSHLPPPLTDFCHKLMTQAYLFYQSNQLFPDILLML